MRTSFLPFSTPSVSDEEIFAVADVLRSGWITTGPNCAKFEAAFASYCGAEGAVAVASATGGMHCVLQALEVGAGDEVITPSMTWVSTVNLICLLGATPVFADIDRDTLMVSRATVEPLITEKTKVIIPVHYAGAPVDMDPIRELATEHGIALIEDAAHAAGTEYKGERIGKKGTCIFSFHPIKNMTTAEGGMVCSDNSELLDKVKSLKFHGLGVDAFDRQIKGRTPQAQVIQPGYKYNLTDISAVLGLGQLERLDAFNTRRTELVTRYHEKLADLPEIQPLKFPAYPHTHAWHLFIVRLDIYKAGLERDAFMAALKEQNIGTGLHFRAVHLQKYYTETFGCHPGMLPETEWNSDRICSLPLCPSMQDSDVDDVVAAIKTVLKKG
ncbi:aminotransferase class I/II-fold pyridoxal phosphate-dependent enzyme [Pontiella agarivorans]|uniref:Aminotransferase class I/II-fold pyridoxal phosphate-dependent enzyme n=1 Tax=Pontiella agarivorans TaxID=3038953 RepID=A0ABU5N1D0_9BACT|nr:aminotransferase class I/II-fold pyridoxal phosphate-dependent enzyme [Pontiella agarivorans]MDZ8120166.1 aminotransferase class I/II-fold pyridoxal phosphate-dependent enzyme [Pontiella agarivorans]